MIITKGNAMVIKITYEEIDKESYVTAVGRAHGCICDVIRSVGKYKKAGQKFNLLLTKDAPMPPTNRLISKIPRYSESIGIPMTRLLKFVKTNNK